MGDIIPHLRRRILTYHFYLGRMDWHRNYRGGNFEFFDYCRKVQIKYNRTYITI